MRERVPTWREGDEGGGITGVEREKEREKERE